MCFPKCLKGCLLLVQLCCSEYKHVTMRQYGRGKVIMLEQLGIIISAYVKQPSKKTSRLIHFNRAVSRLLNYTIVVCIILQ